MDGLASLAMHLLVFVEFAAAKNQHLGWHRDVIVFFSSYRPVLAL
jgi:hypothetical protein